MADAENEQVVSVKLRRLAPDRQARLDHLMEKSNEGVLTRDERDQLRSLVAEYEAALVQNSEALLRATRPDLVSASGQIDRALLASAARRMARAVRDPNAE